MSFLPTQPIARLATKDDLIELGAMLEMRLGGRIDGLEGYASKGFDAPRRPSTVVWGGLRTQYGRIQQAPRHDVPDHGSGPHRHVATMIAGTFFG